MNSDDACRELIRKIDSGKIKTGQQLELAKTGIAREFYLNRIIKNAELILYAERHGHALASLKRLLRTKPTRTLSGVANVAVMWLGDGGFSCPFSCVYCPKKSRSPKSYIGVEPTTLRALRNGFDPHLQVLNRLRQFHALGHETDKCELIVMGGTFLAWQRERCTDFVKRCYDALNGRESKSIEEAHGLNETAANRCVGLTIETRGDCCTRQQIDYMLSLGTTRVEIGVQTTDDNLLKLARRGHDATANTEAFSRLRDAGLKVTAHWMPGLTGLEKLDMKKEIASFKELFDNPLYRPDELKIYPVLVIPGTKLHEMWKKGEYEAMDFNQTLDLLIELKKIVPKYVRIKRISRDISEHEIAAGPGTTNLRQIAAGSMHRLGIKCNCIRCREIGSREGNKENAKLRQLEYDASGGKEIFLSFEDGDSLIAFLRLRIDGSDAAKVRELHVYGEMAPIGANAERNKMAIDLRSRGMWQHSGFGKRLMKEAERIAVDRGKTKMQVTSGVGAREYYRKLGYALRGHYMQKKI